jgi:CheY-like chemotaxis protein
MTANVMAHQVAQYRAVGMDGVVAKPLSPSDIIAKIARLDEPRQPQELLHGT